MLSSNVQSIDLPIDYMAWRFWTMRQTNGCSTPALRSSAAKQWFEQLAPKKKKKNKQKCHNSSLVIRWAYQHQILADEVKNSAKAKLLSFNRTDVFLYEVSTPECDILEAR